MKSKLLIVLLFLFAPPVFAQEVSPHDLLKDAMPLLAPWVKVWMPWMGLVMLGSLVFFKNHVVARWLALFFFTSFAVIPLLVFIRGPAVATVGLASAVHVVFWTPALVLLTRQIEKLEMKTAYGVWCMALIATLFVSLLIDYKTAGTWLFG